MDGRRVNALAAAYGGDPRRWPAAERAAAHAWMAAHPDEAAQLLFEARQIDVILDASARPRVSRALQDQVLADAVAARRAPRPGGFGLGRRAGRSVWWSGAGWVAAACAGIVVGQGVVGRMTTNLQADAVLYQASLAAVDDAEVLG